MNETAKDVNERESFPDIHKAYDPKDSDLPGLPGGEIPDGLWRIIDTTTVIYGNLPVCVITEECYGYHETNWYQPVEGQQVAHDYFVTIAEGFRPTRLRKVMVTEIPKLEEPVMFGTFN